MVAFGNKVIELVPLPKTSPHVLMPIQNTLLHKSAIAKNDNLWYCLMKMRDSCLHQPTSPEPNMWKFATILLKHWGCWERNTKEWVPNWRQHDSLHSAFFWQPGRNCIRLRKLRVQELETCEKITYCEHGENEISLRWRSKRRIYP